mmetsp:Transcript_35475/g.83708  ORF Transcript_35475/g.83708 Transcript_35475/m.83708 type:complete len:244 (-) Transcript_35475:85-816(-)
MHRLRPRLLGRADAALQEQDNARHLRIRHLRLSRQPAPVGSEGVRLAHADVVVVVVALHCATHQARTLKHSARRVRRAVPARLRPNLRPVGKRQVRAAAIGLHPEQQKEEVLARRRGRLGALEGRHHHVHSLGAAPPHAARPHRLHVCRLGALETSDAEEPPPSRRRYRRARRARCAKTPPHRHRVAPSSPPRRPPPLCPHAPHRPGPRSRPAPPAAPRRCRPATARVRLVACPSSRPSSYRP